MEPPQRTESELPQLSGEYQKSHCYKDKSVVLEWNDVRYAKKHLRNRVSSDFHVQ